MSCSNWERLLSSKEALLREGSAERLDAEAHFEVCPTCASRAFLLDPSWAVRGLPRVRFEEHEVEEVRRGVSKTERLREVERAMGPGKYWARAAVVAAFVILAAVAGLLRRADPGSVGSPILGLESSEPRGAPFAGAIEVGPAVRVDRSLPAIGSLAPAAARVYELGEENFALVMVVHETLDI